MNKIILEDLDVDKLNKNLLDDIENYIDTSKSGNTRKAYEKDWKDFVRFCNYTKKKYLPAEYTTVSKYLVYCSSIQKLKISTVERRLASIIFKHRESLHTIDRKHKLIQSIIDGIKRSSGSKPDSSKALSITEIKSIIDYIDSEKKMSVLREIIEIKH